MAKKALSFEASLARLEEIVKTMEAGDITLEESMKLFEEGTSLSARCASLLDEAELKITKVTQGADGSPVMKEISEDELQ